MAAAATAFGSGLESDEPPTPPAAMVARVVPAICCCQSWMASGRNPLMTRGVSIIWKSCIWRSGREELAAEADGLLEVARLAWRDGPAPFEMGRSRTSSICSMGVMPAMGSFENWPMR